MSECSCTSCKLDRIINLLTEQGAKLMALQDDLSNVVTQLGKAKGEILAKVAELESQVANLQGLVEANSAAAAELAAATQSVADLKVAAQALDDVVPDQT